MANVVTKPILLDETGQVIAQALQTIAGTRPDRLSKFAADIADVESSTTSAHAYAVDDFLMLNDQLYIVTSAIQIGDTLTVGTNILATTITDNLGGSGAGGHIIENSSGTDMTARSNLQFINSTVTDDSTNDRTIVAPNNITTTTTDPGEGSALATNCLLFVIEE